MGFKYNASICGFRNITKEELIEDVHTYAAYIDEIHTDPYRMISKASFHGKVEGLIKKVNELNNDSISSLDCFFYFAELSASIQDGHTRIYPPSDLFSDKLDVFPLRLKIIDGDAYVLDSLRPEIAPPYCLLLEIDEISIETFYKNCSPLFNTSLDHAKINLFQELFPLILPTYLKHRPPWKIKHKSNSIIRADKLEAVTLKELNDKLPQHDNKYRDYSIIIQDVEIPILKLPNFSYGKTEKYKHYIDSFSNQYTEPSYLVIDIRENRGGSGY